MFAMGVVALSMVSCGNSTKPEPAEVVTEAIDTIVDESVVTNLEDVSKALESGDAEAVEDGLKKLQEKVEKFVEGGDVEAAKAQVLQIQKWYEENKQKVEEVAKNGATIGQLVNTISNLPTTVEDNANAAADAVKADAEAVKDAAKQKAEEVKQDAKQEVENKVNETAEKAAQKANEAVNNATKKAAQKLLGQ